MVQTFKRYDDIQERYAASVNGEGSSLNEGSELTFSVLIPFRTEAFCQRIKQLFDNRVLKSKKDIINVEDFNIDQFDETALEKLIKACLNQTIPFQRALHRKVRSEAYWIIGIMLLTTSKWGTT